MITAALSLLVTLSIVGTAGLRPVAEWMIHRAVAAVIARQYLDRREYFGWHHMASLYRSLGEELTGSTECTLTPLEAVRILRMAEGELVTDPDPEKTETRRALVINARETFPTTFDCYRFSGAHPALFAGVAALYSVMAAPGLRIAIVVQVVLGILFLVSLPETVLTVLAVIRSIRRYASIGG